MSLASRRTNAPTQISFATYLQGAYANRSFGSLESDNSAEVLTQQAQPPPPTYETTLRIDNNADVVTTAVELDSEDEDDNDYSFVSRTEGRTPRAMPITITKVPDSPAMTPLARQQRRSSCSKSPVALRSPKRVLDMFLKKPNVQLTARKSSPTRTRSVASQTTTAPRAQYLMTRRPSMPGSGFATELPSSVAWTQAMDRAIYVEKLDRVNDLLERGELRAARRAVREAFDGKCELVQFDKIGSREASPVRLYLDTSASAAEVASSCSDDEDEVEEDIVSELSSNADYDTFGRQRHVERGRKRSTITYVPDEEEEQQVDDYEFGSNCDVATELGNAANNASTSLTCSISAKLKKFRFGRAPSQSRERHALAPSNAFATSVTRIDPTLDQSWAAAVADRRPSTASSYGGRSIRSVGSNNTSSNIAAASGVYNHARRASLAPSIVPSSTARTSISRPSDPFLNVPSADGLALAQPQASAQQQERRVPREAWCLLFHPVD